MEKKIRLIKATTSAVRDIRDTHAGMTVDNFCDFDTVADDLPDEEAAKKLLRKYPPVVKSEIYPVWGTCYKLTEYLIEYYTVDNDGEIDTSGSDGYDFNSLDGCTCDNWVFSDGRWTFVSTDDFDEEE